MKNKLILTIMILFITNKIFACECAEIGIVTGQNINDRFIINGFKNADFIFYGEVVEFTDRQIEGYSEIFGWENPKYLKEKTVGYFPIFNIIISLKDNKTHLKNEKIQIYQDWSNCDMIFEKGKKYVIFSYLDKEGKLKTNICAPNKMILSKRDLRNIKKYKID